MSVCVYACAWISIGSHRESNIYIYIYIYIYICTCIYCSLYLFHCLYIITLSNTLSRYVFLSLYCSPYVLQERAMRSALYAHIYSSLNDSDSSLPPFFLVCILVVTHSLSLPLPLSVTLSLSVSRSFFRLIWSKNVRFLQIWKNSG